MNFPAPWDHEVDDETQELPPVITEKARVSLPLAVLIPCVISLVGAIAWSTKFYLGQVANQAQVAELASTLAVMQREQAAVSTRVEKIQSDVAQIRAALGRPVTGLTKSTPTIDLFTSQELP